MSKWIPRIIRNVLTLALIFGAYTETGIWTALNLTGIWLAIEAFTLRNKPTERRDQNE